MRSRHTTDAAARPDNPRRPMPPAGTRPGTAERATTGRIHGRPRSWRDRPTRIKYLYGTSRGTSCYRPHLLGKQCRHDTSKWPPPEPPAGDVGTSDQRCCRQRRRPRGPCHGCRRHTRRADANDATRRDRCPVALRRLAVADRRGRPIDRARRRLAVVGRVDVNVLGAPSAAHSAAMTARWTTGIVETCPGDNIQ
jgi:hypothetical protein